MTGPSRTKLKSAIPHQTFQLGAWTVDPASCRLSQGSDTVKIEPKVMDVLALLASSPGEVCTRDDLECTIWPDMIVGEDTVARSVSRLRRMLGDSAKNPIYIETIPKRGYRLIAPVEFLRENPPAKTPAMPLIGGRPARAQVTGLIIATAALFCAAYIFIMASSDPALLQPAQPTDIENLTDRADDLYIRFTHADNEAAIALYERVLALDETYAPAQAGLANALVQRVIRWPRHNSGNGASSIGEALDTGVTTTPEAQNILRRAGAMAERAVRLDPDNADALKSLGLVYSAQGEIDKAKDTYLRAIDIDPQAWEAQVNLGEIHSIQGEDDAALARFEQAYAVMDANYSREPQRIGPWQAALSVLIGDYYAEKDALGDAELWYRRTLEHAPYNVDATKRLARILENGGDPAQADALCLSLTLSLGDVGECPD